MGSELKSAAPFDIELHDVTFTEHIAVCEVASSDKFVRNTKDSGLRIFYCGAYILFERDGYAEEAVDSGLCKRMRALKDVEGIGNRRAEIEAERKAKAEADKIIEFAAKKKAEEEYRAEKEAQIKAKMANRNFDNAPKVESKPSVDPSTLVTLELATDAGYSLVGAHAIVARNEALNAGMSEEEADQLANEAVQEFRERNAVVPSPVDADEMLRDMKAERGSQMSDGEAKSMKAAIARSKRGR